MAFGRGQQRGAVAGCSIGQEGCRDVWGGVGVAVLFRQLFFREEEGWVWSMDMSGAVS